MQRAERVAQRVYLRKMIVDPEFADVAQAPSRERDRGSCPSCRSAVIIRWLEKRVGHQWDDVFAELVRTFDRRTRRGYHLIDDHIIRHGCLGGLVVPERVAALAPASWVNAVKFVITADGCLEDRRA